MKDSEKAVILIDAANIAWASTSSPFGTPEVFAECMTLLCDVYKRAKEAESGGDQVHP